MDLVKASADDIVKEIEAVANFIAPLFSLQPSDVYLQRVPDQPKSNELSVLFQNASTQQETALTYVDVREWQIIYFGEPESTHPADPNALMAMERIKKHTFGAVRQAIPIDDGSLRYMRIQNNGFTFGAPVKTEDGRWASLGVLRTEVRRARDYEVYQKIMDTGVRRG